MISVGSGLHSEAKASRCGTGIHFFVDWPVLGIFWIIRRELMAGAAGELYRVRFDHLMVMMIVAVGRRLGLGVHFDSWRLGQTGRKRVSRLENQLIPLLERCDVV